mgnify:CR=1 FL=1
MNLFHLLVLILLIISITSERVQNPHGIVLNEIFTFGQQRNLFTNGIPYIELFRSTNQEASLDKYSIVIFSVNNQKMIRLRAVMDLKSLKFKEGQRYGVIGDGPFEYKLHDTEMKATPGILFNEQFNSLDYLSVGNKQYQVIVLMYSGGES